MLRIIIISTQKHTKHCSLSRQLYVEFKVKQVCAFLSKEPIFFFKFKNIAASLPVAQSH